MSGPSDSHLPTARRTLRPPQPRGRAGRGHGVLRPAGARAERPGDDGLLPPHARGVPAVRAAAGGSVARRAARSVPRTVRAAHHHRRGDPGRGRPALPAGAPCERQPRPGRTTPPARFPRALEATGRGLRAAHLHEGGLLGLRRFHRRAVQTGEAGVLAVWFGAGRVAGAHRGEPRPGPRPGDGGVAAQLRRAHPGPRCCPSGW